MGFVRPLVNYQAIGGKGHQCEKAVETGRITSHDQAQVTAQSQAPARQEPFQILVVQITQREQPGTAPEQPGQGKKGTPQLIHQPETVDHQPLQRELPSRLIERYHQ